MDDYADHSLTLTPAAGAEEVHALRELLVSVADQRREVHEFREAELADIAESRRSARSREQAAVRSCSKRVAELADKMAQEALEREMGTLDDDEAELMELNSLRMQVARQEVSGPTGEAA